MQAVSNISILNEVTEQHLKWLGPAIRACQHNQAVSKASNLYDHRLRSALEMYLGSQPNRIRAPATALLKAASDELLFAIRQVDLHKSNPLPPNLKPNDPTYKIVRLGGQRYVVYR